jgi:hypothetical protein
VAVNNYALLGDYAVSSGISLPMFGDNISVPSSRFKNPQQSLLPQYGVHDMTTDINTKFRQHPASFL